MEKEKDFIKELLLLAAEEVVCKSLDATSKIAVLTHCMEKSCNDYRIVTLLIKTLLSNGCVSEVFKLVEVLDVKHILTDTISHVYCNGMEVLLLGKKAEELFNRTLQIYKSNEVEVSIYFSYFLFLKDSRYDC